MAMLVLPLVMEYDNNGFFDWRAKLHHTVRRCGCCRSSRFCCRVVLYESYVSGVA